MPKKQDPNNNVQDNEGQNQNELNQEENFHLLQNDDQNQNHEVKNDQQQPNVVDERKENPAGEPLKANLDAGKQEAQFDFDSIRSNPDVWKRLVTPVDKKGSMGNVFSNSANPFAENAENEISRLKNLVTEGKLYLREKGSQKVQKIEKVGNDYRLGEAVNNKLKAPYDPILGTLLRIADRYFKGIFGRDWFSNMANRYRSYRSMRKSLRAEVKEIKKEEKKEEKRITKERDKEKKKQERIKANKDSLSKAGQRAEKKAKKRAEKLRKQRQKATDKYKKHKEKMAALEKKQKEKLEAKVRKFLKKQEEIEKKAAKQREKERKKDQGIELIPEEMVEMQAIQNEEEPKENERDQQEPVDENLHMQDRVDENQNIQEPDANLLDAGDDILVQDGDNGNLIMDEGNQVNIIQDVQIDVQQKEIGENLPKKEKISIQQPNEKVHDKKQILKDRLAEEKKAWNGVSKDWKAQIENRLFHSEGALKQEYKQEIEKGELSGKDYLIGCFAGVAAAGIQGKADPKNQKKLMDNLLDRNGQIGKEFDGIIQNGAEGYKYAKNQLENGNQGPMTKLLHDAALGMAEAASNAPNLSERHYVIASCLNEINFIASSNGLDLGFSPKEKASVQGAMEMGKIATKGASAFQKLGNMENLDMKNPDTQKSLVDYFTMKAVDSGLQLNIGGNLQVVMGDLGGNGRMSELTANNSMLKELIKNPKGTDELNNMLESPNSFVAGEFGRKLLTENYTVLADEANGVKKGVGHQKTFVYEHNKQKVNVV